MASGFVLVTDLEALMDEVRGLTEDDRKEIRRLVGHLKGNPFKLPSYYTYHELNRTTGSRRATIDRIGISVAYVVDVAAFTIEITAIRERGLRRVGLVPRLPGRKRST